MEGPAFLLAVIDESSNMLVGAAVVLADDATLGVFESLDASATTLAGKVSGAASVCMSGVEPDGFLSLDDFADDPDDMLLDKLYAIAEGSEDEPIVVDASTLPEPFSTPELYARGETNAGRVRALSINVSNGEVFFCGIAAENDECEDVRIRTSRLQVSALRNLVESDRSIARVQGSVVTIGGVEYGGWVTDYGHLAVQVGNLWKLYRPVDGEASVYRLYGTEMYQPTSVALADSHAAAKAVYRRPPGF